MGFQQFQGSRGTHLGRDDAGQVVFHTDDIDGCEPAVLHNELQCSLKALVLLAFPMEMEADSDARQFKSIGSLILRFEQQFVVLAPVPEHLAFFADRNLPSASHCMMGYQSAAIISPHQIGRRQGEVYLRGRQDAYL